MKVGYTKAYRKELESNIWKMPPLYQRVFFYLRQIAVWQPELFPTRQEYKIALNPGQLITSLSIIADGVSWYEYGVKKTPNKKIIKDILRWLESNSMVTVFSNRHGTFIIIINWCSYNSNGNEKVTQKKRQKVTQKKRNVDTLKEDKEDKEIKNIYIAVYNFWNDQNIVRHNKKTESMDKAIKKALKDYSQDEIIAAIRNYAIVYISEKHYFSHKWCLTDFLNRGLPKFLDEADPLNNYKTDKQKSSLSTAIFDDMKEA